MVTPDGAEWAPRPRVDNAMVKALARAFRWRKMLDEGVHATLEDLARVKGLAPSYVSGILRLTLLALEIVVAILDGRQPAEMQLDDLLNAFPLEWAGQFDNMYRRRASDVAPLPRDQSAYSPAVAFPGRAISRRTSAERQVTTVAARPSNAETATT